MRLLLSVLLTASFVAAQVNAPLVITEKMKEGRRLIEESIEALGGDVFLRMTTKIEYGRMYSFYNRELTGRTKATVYTKYLIAPEHPPPDAFYIRERLSYGGKDKEKWAVLFNEDDGFEITFRGIRPMSELAIAQFRERRRKDIFYIMLRRMGEAGLTFERVGREVIDNQPMEIVDIIDGNNEVATVYLHYKTKLPRRQQFEYRGEDRVRHVTMTIYDKFRDAGGGIMLPRVVQRERDGQKVFSMFAESVTTNEPLSEDILGLPADMKILERSQ
jgi:hypothetical protein